MEKALLTIGVVGGSSFYSFDGLSDVREIPVVTPFGMTPDPIIEGWFGETRMLFASRHRKGHRLCPHEVPYQAIIFALKSLGAECVIGVSAVGSLRENIRPGDLAVVRQFFDATHGRSDTFFGNGIVGHVSLADPVCPALADAMVRAARELDITTHPDAVLKVMQGPWFSTRAESRMNRQLGFDLIGMTSAPEYKLAREAELCFVTLALVTDFDCWREEEADVTAELVTTRLARNVSKAKLVIKRVAEIMLAQRKSGQGVVVCGCSRALDHAVVTDRALIPELFRTGSMATIFGRVLGNRT